MNRPRFTSIRVMKTAPRSRRGCQVRGLLAAIGFASLFPICLSAQTDKPLIVPSLDPGIQEMEQRAEAQRKTAATMAPFHDFSFVDRLPESGITFEQRPTLDSTVAYKMVHYDHGTAIAVADVDGDGALDIYFVTQMGDNQLWRNKGKGLFEQITARSPGLGVSDRVSVGASFADIDNDGDADLYVTTVRMGNLLFRNDGKGRFTDISKESGTDHVAHSSGAVFFDMDNDGLLDLFVTNVGRYTNDERGEGGYYIGLEDAFSGHRHPERTERSTIYRNLGKGRFEDVTAKVGLAEDGWAGDASFADLDGDGFSDLYVLNMQGDDHYWHNVGGKKFEDLTAKTFAKTPWGAMGISFFDWDNDGDLDLFLTDMHSDMSASVTPANEKLKSFVTWDDEHLQGGANNVFGNAFYRNDKGVMTEVSDAVGAENYWPWGISVGDLNADGFEDAILTSSMNYPFRYIENSVLLNDGGKSFQRAEYLLGIEPRRNGPQKQWFEMTCPPGPDTAPAPLDAIRTMLRQCGFREGTFPVIGTRGTRTAAIFDLDGDGDQDLVTGEFNDAPQVLVSNLSDKKKIQFLSLKLEGTKSNRDGLGAQITVKAGKDQFYRHHDGKLGYLGQSSHPVFVGLGSHEKVDSVMIRWPSGVVQTLENPALNQTVMVKEPAG